MLSAIFQRLFPARRSETASRAPAEVPAPQAKDSVELSTAAKPAPTPRKVYGAATQYPDSQGYLEEMQALVEAHPQNAKLLELGHSVQGRVLQGLTLGQGPIGAVITGLVHASEWATGRAGMEACRELLESRPELLEAMTIHVVPVCNPDGYELSRHAMPRQRGNLHSVDLNRNFPANWGPNEENSKAFCDEFGGIGERPLSEPESQALAGLLDRDPNIKGWIDFHSYGEMYLYPENERPEAYRNLLDSLAQAAPFEAKKIQDFQPIKGSLAEFCESRGVLAVGVELGQTFKPIDSQREHDIETGKTIALHFLEHLKDAPAS